MRSHFAITLVSIAPLVCIAAPAAADEVPCNALFSDLNGDYIVDGTDFHILADQFGQECEEGAADCHLVADLNADNHVGLWDVFLLSDQLNLTCDPEAPPAEYDELQVRYIIADMQLGGPAGNVRLNPQDAVPERLKIAVGGTEKIQNLAVLRGSTKPVLVNSTKQSMRP